MITPAQRESRRKYIGSSDSAAIMGLDPYKSAADVFLDKTGRAADFEGNADTDRGNLLEPVVLNWAEQQIGRSFERDCMVVNYDVLAANLDGMCADPDPPFLVEAKTTVNDEGWGDEGSDEIPDRVLVQVHHQFAVAGAGYRLAYVPVLLPAFKRFDFRMYRVARNEDLCKIVTDRGIEFMEKYVRTDTPPDDFRPSMEVLKRMRRQPNKTVPIAGALVDQWIACKAAASQAEDDAEAAQAALLAAMGDAEAGSYAMGTITYMEMARKAYSVEATAFRQLRLKKSK